jgi:hypothetical protein
MVLPDEDRIAFFIADMMEYDYKRAPDDLKNNPDVAKALVEKHGLALEIVPEPLRDNKEVVLAAVREYGGALRYASEKLRDDAKVVLEAIGSTVRSIEYASTRLKSDREIVLKALSQEASWDMLANVDPSFRSDLQMVMAAVSNTGCALEHASDNLKEDRDVCLTAVKQDGKAIQYVGDCLFQDDREIALEAAKSNSEALGYMSGDLPEQHNPFDPFGGGMNANNKPPPRKNKFAQDREVILAAIRPDGHCYRSGALQYAPSRFKADKEIVIEAVKRSGCALDYASDTLKDDRDVVTVAVMDAGVSLIYASDKLKNDKDIVMAAIAGYQVRMGHAEGSSNYLDPVSVPLQVASKTLCDDAETMLSIYENCDGCCYETCRISDRLRDDKEFVLAAAYISGDQILKIASARMKTDPDILAAIKEYNNWNDYLDEKQGSREKEAKKKFFAARTAKRPKGKSIVLHNNIKEFTDDALYKNNKLARRAVQYNGLYLHFVSKELRSNREFVRRAIVGPHGNGLAIQWSKPSFWSDRQLILEAVKSNGCALEFASKSLQADREIVEAAVLENGGALHYADKKFLLDKELVLRSIKNCDDKEMINDLFRCLPNEVKIQKDIIHAVIESGCPSIVLYHAGEAVSDNEELFLRAVEMEKLETHKSENMFRYASRRLWRSKSFIFKALWASPTNIGYVPYDILAEENFIQDALGTARFAMQLKRLKGEVLSPFKRLKGEVLISPEMSKEDWILLLDRASKLYNPAASLSAIFYIVSCTPEFCRDARVLQRCHSKR